MKKPAYEQLETRFKRIEVVNSVNGLLNWDSATMMAQAYNLIKQMDPVGVLQA